VTPPSFAGITADVTGAIAHHGAYAVFAAMALDAMLPFGSELIMLYAGVLAAGAVGGGQVALFGGHVRFGGESYALLVAAGTLGSLAGALVGYGVGAFGRRALVDQCRRWPRLSPESFERAEAWFARYGNLAVFLGRLTPVVRSLISIPAGAWRVPLGLYMVSTLLGSLVWCLAFAGLGWSLAGAWESFHRDFRYADYAVVGAIAALVVVAAVRHRRGTVNAEA
jgi:membrane protein DedA with SNARE-associated domain